MKPVLEDIFIGPMASPLGRDRMKPVLEDIFIGPMASPSFSSGFRWEDSRRRVHVVFAGVTVADSKRVMLLHELGPPKALTKIDIIQ